MNFRLKLKLVQVLRNHQKVKLAKFSSKSKTEDFQQTIYIAKNSIFVLEAFWFSSYLIETYNDVRGIIKKFSYREIFMKIGQ